MTFPTGVLSQRFVGDLCVISRMDTNTSTESSSVHRKHHRKKHKHRPISLQESTARVSGLDFADATVTQFLSVSASESHLDNENNLSVPSARARPKSPYQTTVRSRSYSPAVRTLGRSPGATSARIFLGDQDAQFNNDSLRSTQTQSTGPQWVNLSHCPMCKRDIESSDMAVHIRDVYEQFVQHEELIGAQERQLLDEERAELDRHKDEFEALKKSNDESLAGIKKQNELIKDLIARQQAAADEKQTLLSDIKVLREQLASVEASAKPGIDESIIEKYKQEINGHRVIQNNFEIKTKDCELQIKQLEHENSRLAQRDQENQAKILQLARYELDAKHLSNRVDELKIEVEKERMRGSTIQDKLDRLINTQLEKQRTDLSQSFTTAPTNHGIQNEINELQAVIQSLNQEKDTLARTLNTNREPSSKELDDNSKHLLDQLQEQNKALVNEHGMTIKALQQHNETLSKQCNNLVHEKESFATKLNNIREEAKLLQDQLLILKESTVDKLSLKDKEIEQIKLECSIKLKEKDQESQGKSASLAQRINSLEDECKRMEEKILMKEKKINDLLFEKERYESLSEPHRSALDDLLNRHVPETTGSVPITDSNNEAGPVVNVNPKIEAEPRDHAGEARDVEPQSLKNIETIAESYRHLKNMNEVDIFLMNHGISPGDTVWDLSSSNIDDEQCAILGIALESSYSVTTINLFNNKVGDDGCKPLAAAIEKSNNILSIDLGYNEIGPYGASYLAAAIETSQSLSTLDLHHNRIGDEGCKCLAPSLEQSRSLAVLNLQQNDIGDTGCNYFRSAIKGCKQLALLNLRYNSIGGKMIQQLEQQIRAKILT